MAWVENEIFKTMYFLTLRYVTGYCLTLLHLSPDKEIVLQVGPTPLPSYSWMVLWSWLCRKSQRKRDGCLFFTHWHFLDLGEVLVPHPACVHLPSTHCSQTSVSAVAWQTWLTPSDCHPAPLPCCLMLPSGPLASLPPLTVRILWSKIYSFFTHVFSCAYQHLGMMLATDLC